MKTVLIFYSKTGGGHLRAAEAIAEELRLQHPTYKIILKDCLTQTSGGKEFRPDKAFLIFSTTLLFAYNLLYYLLNNTLGTSLLRKFIKTLWGKSMNQVIKDTNPDVIISTHPGCSPQTLTHIPPCAFIAVCTDLSQPHKLWFDSKANATVVATEEIKKYFQKVSNVAPIFVFGLPLKKAFSAIQPASTINNQVLILGGGSGTGNLTQQVSILSTSFPDKKFIVICGINEKVKKEIEQKKYANVLVHGFAHNVAEIMKSSDIVVTKAGPGTIIEAVTFHKPIIITNWIVMQEKGNIDFVVENGLGLYCPDHKKLPETVKKMYENYSSFINEKITITNGTPLIVKKTEEYLS